MTTQPSTTAGTWAPDWDAIRKASNGPFSGVPFSSDAQYHAHICQAMAAEYQRQAAAAGLVLVRRSSLQHHRRELKWLERPGVLHGVHYSVVHSLMDWLDSVIAATPEPAPGGDGS